MEESDNNLVVAELTGDVVDDLESLRLVRGRKRLISDGYTGRGTGIGGEMNEGGEGGSRNELVSAADCNRAGAKWA
ncbi:unnamed protein product [Microthlaspi erraticum]|uniref:Uncharacterized protein n=1 Tax=Microthlaspi erraticum TaxID=1685480 RepID=A0A6D2IZD0_9BRAS|nr:unnamed protein product [Microthlaspi erraticum]